MLEVGETIEHIGLHVDELVDAVAFVGLHHLFGEAGQDEDDNQEPAEETPSAVFMVFDSGGTLRYDARVVNGEVVDSYGNPIAGCYVNEAGNVKDAYWNEIDPRTGELIQP